ncbi:MAG TPA: carboxypeptidase-like regulatory domain-containing protein [Candidatus Nitrosotalea sp.]|nr:carboxypeptidase regulatory-like domain-containing protein [Nitrososphaerota archaeon]HKU33128.1 carboxypeptidase-like regulatory domain-containing protein [Candidatus Nitrosotalea sp.]
MKINHLALIPIVAILFVIAFSSVQVSHSVLTYKMLVSVKPQKDPIMQGDYPVIVGNVTDEAYKPVTNANVFIIFGSEAVTTTTDNQGQFKYQSAIPATPGTYEIDVTITKPGYVKQLASSAYTVNPYPTTKTTVANVTTPITNLISGLPVFAGNYTVYLGKVAQWNLETTCFVDFSDKYVRFLKTCDLYNLDPQDFKIDQQVIPMVSVIQYNNTYRLFPDNVYNEAYYLGNDTAEGFIEETWKSYTAPN